ncbi:MAG: PDZ domain-containing protein [Planctomycetota bacterium]
MGLAFGVTVGMCGLVACAADNVGATRQISDKIALEIAQPAGGHRPHAGMLRYPDISATQVVFLYANNLWVAPRTGGMAIPLTSPAGLETFPRFSPDGNTIAFVGNYEGNRDLYTIPVDGGTSTRLTHHPAGETLCDWTNDGRLIYFTNGFGGLARQMQLYTVPATGGLPAKLPVPYGANGSISSDGRWLAYTLHTADHRTWKRYRGGMATDVWLFDLKDNKSKKMTDWEGTDSQPMWHGSKVYYMSDAGPDHRLNIWSYDPATNRREQVTKFTDFDVKWPSVGPGADGSGEIIFQLGPELRVVSLSNGQSRTIEITIPGDRPTIRPKDFDAAKFIQSWDISATGERALFEARGDLWTVPAKKGTPRNLTRTEGMAERTPAWSPDAQWIAYFSDATGEYELYITESKGRGETRQLTSDGKIYRKVPDWSPDSKHIAFSDKSGALYLHTIESKETKLIDTDPFQPSDRVSWSSDSRWLAYVLNQANTRGAIWIYNTETGQKTKATSGMFNDMWPTFDRKGDYLFFTSQRNFGTPAYEDVGTTFIYADTSVLAVVPLRAKVGSPWAPKSDEELWGKEKEEKEKKDKDEKDAAKKDDKKEEKPKDGEKKEEDKPKETDADATKTADAKDEKGGDKKDEKSDKKEPPKPVEIELEGFERRAVLLPVDKGTFSWLAVNDEGKLLYVREAARGTTAKPSLKIFDLKDEEKKEKTVLDEIGAFEISADGKKIIVRKEETLAIVTAAAEQKLDKPLDLSAMTGRIDPRIEWKQLFTEAWRIQRDYFYDPNMHGVDWPAIRKQYEKMVADCASREDVEYVIGEMISELNVGHAYVRGGGDFQTESTVPVGLLGATFEWNDGAYRIVGILEGAAWDVDARGPLSQPGVDVKIGDYLLAVNSVPVDAKKDPWAAFLGLAGKVVTLTVSAKPQIDSDARQVVVELLKSDDELRYRAWIEQKRALVDQKSGGRIGYIYVPNTGTNGQNDLFRQFYCQTDKDALIIDERWNGGGQIPTRFIELLNRPVTNYWARREGTDWTWPPDSQQGPKCMLINGLAGSGGDCFPYYFRQRGLGKLIGTRTWGGLVGISGNPQLIDNGQTSSPTFAFYETDGTWGVEGHGVDPDIEVIDDPALMVNGGDPQLDKAIEHMLAEIARKPYVKPKRPAYPDRKGMGIKPEDK